jgi:hypothetical protein
MAPDPKDIRVMVPRVRRAVLGVAPADPNVLSDDQLKDLVADALAEVLLYTGSVFGKTLIATELDPDSGAPTEYETSDPLTLSEQTVVAAQAALNYFFHAFVDRKTSEHLQDEAVTWEWTKSAQMMRDQFAALIAARDRALDALTEGQARDVFTSYLAVRDRQVSALIEPWADVSGATVPMLGTGLETDFRFG